MSATPQDKEQYLHDELDVQEQVAMLQDLFLACTPEDQRAFLDYIHAEMLPPDDLLSSA